MLFLKWGLDRSGPNVGSEKPCWMSIRRRAVGRPADAGGGIVFWLGLFCRGAVLKDLVMDENPVMRTGWLLLCYRRLGQ